MERKTFSQLPLGVSDFHKLRELGKIYVDKTGLLYDLITTFEKVFLARPRRFGKSLLVSTFESLFKLSLIHIFRNQRRNQKTTSGERRT